MVKESKKAFFIKGLSPDRASKVASMDPYYRNMKLQLPGNNNLDTFGRIQGIKSIGICFNGRPFKMGIPDILVNCMADPDSLEARLKYLETVIPQLQKQNPSIKIINHPSGILKTGRNTISDLFTEKLENIIVPKVIKLFPKSRRELIENIKNNKIKLPVLVREAAVHGGIKLTLLSNFSEKEVEQLDKFAFDGRAHYVTEFYNFKSDDSLYRKVRIVMINGVPHFRHMIIGDHWNIHNNSREEFMSKHKQLAAEEENFLKAGINNFSREVQEDIQRIYKTLKLDMFGMDVGILPDGRLLVFEINAAMEFLALHVKHAPYIMDQIKAIRINFLKLIASPRVKLAKAA